LLAFRYWSLPVLELVPVEPGDPLEPLVPLEPPMFGQSCVPRPPYAGVDGADEFDGADGAVVLPELGVVVLDVAAPAVPT